MERKGKFGDSCPIPGILCELGMLVNAITVRILTCMDANPQGPVLGRDLRPNHLSEMGLPLLSTPSSRLLLGCPFFRVPEILTNTKSRKNVRDDLLLGSPRANNAHKVDITCIIDIEGMKYERY